MDRFTTAIESGLAFDCGQHHIVLDETTVVLVLYSLYESIMRAS